MDSLSGILYIHTFKKLPIIAPSIKIAMYKKIFFVSFLL